MVARSWVRTMLADQLRKVKTAERPARTMVMMLKTVKTIVAPSRKRKDSFFLPGYIVSSPVT